MPIPTAPTPTDSPLVRAPGLGFVVGEKLSKEARAAYGDEFDALVRRAVKLIEETTEGKNAIQADRRFSPAGRAEAARTLGAEATRKLRSLDRGLVGQLAEKSTELLEEGRLFQPLGWPELRQLVVGNDDAAARDLALRVDHVRRRLADLDPEAAARGLRRAAEEGDVVVWFALETLDPWTLDRLAEVGFRVGFERVALRTKLQPQRFADLDVVAETAAMVSFTLARTREQLRSALVGSGGRLADDDDPKSAELRERADRVAGVLDGLDAPDVQRLRRLADRVVLVRPDSLEPGDIRSDPEKLAEAAAARK